MSHRSEDEHLYAAADDGKRQFAVGLVPCTFLLGAVGGDQ